VRVRTLLVALAIAVLVLGGCSDGRPADDAAPAPTSSPTSSPAAPVLGGERPARHAAPRRAMNRLERPLAAQLARRIASEGLSLGYLDCPRWDGTVPSRMTCRGYVDGLVAQVEVLLKAAVRGRAVRFDAWLADGLIATRTLERTLRDHGWSRPDCGDVPAYPAHAGETLVCRVHRGSAGVARYVVATVTDRSGAVTIAGYRPGSGSL
jgi:hypothetical protein